MKIAFAGRSGAGKDFLAEHLVKDYNFMRLSFSDQLKKIAKYVYPWMESDYPPIEKENKLNIVTEFDEFIEYSPREIWLNTDTLRTIDKFVFIRKFHEELKNLEASSEDIICTDIRTNEELNYCKEQGFVIVFIQPSVQVYENNSFDDFAESVKEVSDYVIENTFDDSVYDSLQSLVLTVNLAETTRINGINE